MDKNILLKFKSRNGYDVGEDNVEFITRGSLNFKNGKYYLKYTEESPENGENKVSTTIKIEDGKVTVLRFGETNTQMIMETGKKHISYYETPYGSIVIGVITDSILSDIGENKGKLCINYALEINDSIMSENCINLSYEAVN